MCVNEQMVSFKEKLSLKQYVSEKIHKWEYKKCVLCDTKGLVHYFDVFKGEIDCAPGRADIATTGNIELNLAQVIPPHVNQLL